MAAIYKNTWLIKNKETDEVFARTESFEEALSIAKLQVQQFSEMLSYDPINGDKPNPAPIAEFVKTTKDRFKDLVFYNPYQDKITGSVWGMIFNNMKHEFFDNRYYNHKSEGILKDLYLRFGSAIGEKIIVKLHPYYGKDKFDEYGIAHVEARLFDVKYDRDWVILSEEQFNFLRLVDDSEKSIMEKFIEVSEIHKDFINHGLV